MLDRIKKAIRMATAMGVAKNQAAIGVMMGYNNATAFSHVLNGVDKIPNNFIGKLQTILPNLNIEWIKTGQGEMFLSNAAAEKNAASQVSIQGSGSTNIQGDNIHDVNSAAALQSLVNEIKAQREMYAAMLEKRDEELARKDGQIAKLLELLAAK